MFDNDSLDLAKDLTLRWQKLRGLIEASGADALLATSVSNLLYLSGRVYIGAFYLPVDGDPVCFVRRPNNLTGKFAMPIRKPEQIPELLAAAGRPAPKRLLLECDMLSHNEWLRYAAAFPGTETGDASQLLRRARAVKSGYELELVRDTCRRHAEIIERFASLFVPGMTDQQWMIKMFSLVLRAGSLGSLRVEGSNMESFIGAVLAGDNGGAPSPFDFALGGGGLSPSLPVGQCGVLIEKGMSVQVDIPANFYGYLSDCSRTFAYGEIDRKARDAHQLSIDISEAVAAAAKPGVDGEYLYQLALDMADKAGFGDCFMGLGQKAKFIAHGVGLVINDWPVFGARSKHVLEPGMCVAMEPKFVIAGTGAVGVEDTYEVTVDGMVQLTNCSRRIREIG